MGWQRAYEFAALWKSGAVTLEHAMQDHLMVNSYPPHPYSMVEVAKAAVLLACEDRWDEPIQLPEGVSWRGQRNWASAFEVVESFRLEPYVEIGRGDDDGDE